MLPYHLVTVIPIMQSLDADGFVAAAALSLAFFTFVRQSNVAVTPSAEWGSDHTIKRQDVSETPTGLLVVIHSSKTHSREDPPLCIPIHPLPGAPVYCPVRQYQTMIRRVPAGPDASAFIKQSNYMPLTTANLMSTLRRALNRASIPGASQFTPHSVRRGASQTAALSGATIQQVKQHGHWTSDAVYKYTPSYMYNTVPSILRDVFAKRK